jgi:hypothetical protein
MTDESEDGGGYDADDWTRLGAFTGRLASLEDVEAGAAVFGLADTGNPHPIVMDLPQPVIWWSDDGEQAAVAIQAESHETEEGETMEVLGLVLPDGTGVVALMDDVDLVDDSDPVWRKLVTEAIGDESE